MKIVNPTELLEVRFGYEKSVRMNCEAGFEGLDYSMCIKDIPIYHDGWRGVVSEMLSIADGYGVPFTQAHGPFGRFQLDEREAREEFDFKGKRAIEVAGLLGAKCIVFHPMRFAVGNHEDQLRYNIEELSKFIPYAKDAGVKIAIENMCLTRPNGRGGAYKHVCKSAEEHAAYIDAFESEWVVACLDTGHAAVSGEIPAEFAKTLGKKRLFALHLQDNDGVSDQHLMPYMSKIDFDDLALSLAEIDYEGDITLEGDSFMSKSPAELTMPGLSLLRACGESIRNRVLHYKKEISK